MSIPVIIDISVEEIERESVRFRRIIEGNAGPYGGIGVPCAIDNHRTADCLTPRFRFDDYSLYLVLTDNDTDRPCMKQQAYTRRPAHVETGVFERFRIEKGSC